MGTGCPLIITLNPTEPPTKNPTLTPSEAPSETSLSPTLPPTKQPTQLPTNNPTDDTPSNAPSIAPTFLCDFMSVTILDVDDLFDVSLFNGLYVLSETVKFDRPKWVNPESPTYENIEYNGFGWNINGMGENTLSYLSNAHFPPHRDLNAEWKHSSLSHETFHVFMDCVHSYPHSPSSANNGSTDNQSTNNSFILMLIGVALSLLLFIICIVVLKWRKSSKQKTFSLVHADDNNPDSIQGTKRISTLDPIEKAMTSKMNGQCSLKDHISTNIEIGAMGLISTSSISPKGTKSHHVRTRKLDQGEDNVELKYISDHLHKLTAPNIEISTLNESQSSVQQNTIYQE